MSYLKDIKNNFKKSWKNHRGMENSITITNNFISSIDNDEEHVMHSECDNIKMMIKDEVDEVVIEVFDLIKNRYQNNLEWVKVSEFVFDYIYLLYYKCQK